MKSLLSRQSKSLLSLKKLVKSPTCQWCSSTEIRLVPVSGLANLKPLEVTLYQKLWQQQGWPTKLYLCWICRLNCELVYQRLNLWLCPKCRKCFAYHWKGKPETPAYQQLPVNCSCGWKKKRLSKKEQQKLADLVIKSRLVYKKDQKTYFAQCSFCNGKIVGKQKDKGVKNRNQVRFWSGKVGEERLVCNGCLRENEEFLGLVLEKNWGRWRVYKSKGLV